MVSMAIVALGWMECLCPPSQRGVRGIRGDRAGQGVRWELGPRWDPLQSGETMVEWGSVPHLWSTRSALRMLLLGH